MTHDFDLFRISKSKEIVDISPETIQEYEAEGLTLYKPVHKKGAAIYVSKSELAMFIRMKSKRPAAVEKEGAVTQ